MNNIVLTDEDYQYINKITENMKQEQITKKTILESIAFAREITNESEDELLYFIDEIYYKINNMSDDEWENVKRSLPYPVLIMAEDEGYF